MACVGATAADTAAPSNNSSSSQQSCSSSSIQAFRQLTCGGEVFLVVVQGPHHRGVHLLHRQVVHHQARGGGCTQQDIRGGAGVLWCHRLNQVGKGIPHDTAGEIAGSWLQLVL